MNNTNFKLKLNKECSFMDEILKVKSEKQIIKKFSFE